MVRRLTVAVLVLLLASSPAAAQRPCALPAGGLDDWPVASPDSVAMDADRLCSLVPVYEKYAEGNLHAVLVARNGKLVFERYFTGTDEVIERTGTRRVAFDAATLHDIRSITKSITALLLGIAIDRGLVAGIDLPVLSFFPEYADLRTLGRERITLRHLLTMSHGLAGKAPDDPAASDRLMWEAKDPARHVFEQRVISAPGEKFAYSGAPAAMIAAVLRKQTGLNLDALAQTWLFDPLGITGVEWTGYTPDTEPMADAGLRMRPRDLAKVGQLILDRGRWNGRQIVSAAWIDAATSPQVQASPQFGSMGYGYQFWLGRSHLEKAGDVPWIAGMGWGGQQLIVVPSLDLVAVIHAGLYAKPQQFTIPAAILNRYILPAAEPR